MPHYPSKNADSIIGGKLFNQTLEVVQDHPEVLDWDVKEADYELAMHNNSQVLQRTDVFVNALEILRNAGEFLKHECIEAIIGKDILHANEEVSIAALGESPLPLLIREPTETFVNELCDFRLTLHKIQKAGDFGLI